MKTQLIVATLASVITSVLVAAESPRVGAAAPDFSLADSKGATHSLADYG